MTHSVQLGAQIATRSPGVMPAATSARAARVASSPELGEGQARPFVDESFAGAVTLHGPSEDGRYRQGFISVRHW